MALSREMRKLVNKWETESSWPKRLEWLEILNVRGWGGQRVDFNFPFVAITGENGVGKSTILQAIASAYKSSEESWFASDFFPDTPWDKITEASIKCSIREGNASTVVSVRKPSDRWRGNPNRRERIVNYIDLRRLQPIAAQTGYARIAKPQNIETNRLAFSAEKLARFSSIIGRPYRDAGFALSDADPNRWVPVADLPECKYSGFHQGAGEATITGLLKVDIPQYSVLLIDEIETSLHPRSQRRLMRDLAEICRLKELQIIITTHSPYILEELPNLGRIYVMNTSQGKTLITGVSPDFAMTQMDEEKHPEADIYVEDERSRIVIEEVVIAQKKELLPRCCIIPFGAASVGQALGKMVKQDRFPRPSLVFLDADQEPAEGCLLLPGDDAPERVVFEGLANKQWAGVAERIERSHSELVDATQTAMTLTNHHDWLKSVADKLIIGSNDLWRAMVISWVKECSIRADARKIVERIQSALDGIKFVDATPNEVPLTNPAPASPNDSPQLFRQ
ncbi:MAG: AAA family ATPase [Tepidisphaeraceae bacterium]|jgi:predicted ATPase